MHKSDIEYLKHLKRATRAGVIASLVALGAIVYISISDIPLAYLFPAFIALWGSSSLAYVSKMGYSRVKIKAEEDSKSNVFQD